MTNKFFPYARQSINEEDILAVQAALRQDFITRGPKTHEFEEAIAAKVSARFAVSFTSASTALFAAFQAADVSAFDRFITTPNSFIATVACAMRLGAKPTFVDIDRTNGSMSLDNIQQVLKEPPSRGRFVIAPVHFAGIAQNMAKLDSALKTPSAVIIEDAAHAIGSLYSDGTPVGSCAYSHMTIFSFHAIKTLTAAEGGCVTTNDEALYNRLLCIRNSGMEKDPQSLWYYEVKELSANFHMTEMQAALGLSQLKRLDAFVEKRRALVAAYRSHLAGAKHIRLFDPSHDAITAYHLMCVQCDFEAIGKTRTQVMQDLKEAGIGTQYHYIPLYRHPAVAKVVGDIAEHYPEMEGYYKQGLSLPLYYDLEEQDVAYICSTLQKAL